MTPFVLAFADAGVAGPDLVPPIWRTGAALLVVVALLVGLAWLLRRSASLGRGRRPMAIEAALALGERRSLAIVTVEGRRLLLGLAPGQVSLVTELTSSPFDQAVARAVEPGEAA